MKLQLRLSSIQSQSRDASSRPPPPTRNRHEGYAVPDTESDPRFWGEKRNQYRPRVSIAGRPVVFENDRRPSRSTS